MKKIIKNNLFGFILGVIVATTTVVTASVLYNASEVGFTPSDTNWHVNNLQDAINDLYSDKATAVQVATLTTKGATYTMQNDGYITGNVSANGVNSSYILIDGVLRFKIHYDDTDVTNASVYAPKDSIVQTGSNGTYNLTVYEWK